MAVDSPARDGAFTVSTGQVRLLELMPEMPEAGFLFRAEVRQDEDPTPGLGRVGLYFGHSRDVADRRVEHDYVALTFGDWPMAGTPDQEVRLCGERHADRDLHAPTFRSLHKHYPPAAGPKVFPMPWRRLAVKVTPHDVEAFWEGESLGTRPLKELHDNFEALNPILAAQGQPECHAEVTPRQAVGLYFSRSTASFRRIVAEPLSPGTPREGENVP